MKKKMIEGIAIAAAVLTGLGFKANTSTARVVFSDGTQVTETRTRKTRKEEKKYPYTPCTCGVECCKALLEGKGGCSVKEE